MEERKRFTGKTVVVTGGSRGIGAQIVKDFCREGAKVCFLYYSSGASALALEEEMRNRGCQCRGIRCDVSKEADCENAAEQIKKSAGKIDILVNNAGITRDNIMLMQSGEEWKQVFEVNLFGTCYMSKYAAMDMIRNRKGVIVNMSSIAGIKGTKGQTAYCASKAAVMAMTRALAREIGQKNIRINAVAPGYIDTEMTRQVKGILNMKEQIPQGRFGKVEEVSAVVLFLASEEASYINGQTIVADGGFTA